MHVVLQTLKMLTHAAFDPVDPNLLAYSTSKSVLCLMDIRQKDLSGSSAVEFNASLTQVCSHAVL
jgi:hypothetical protein